MGAGDGGLAVVLHDLEAATARCMVATLVNIAAKVMNHVCAEVVLQRDIK